MGNPVVKLQGTISRGVKGVYVNVEGNLIFEMSNGESINLGRVTGETGIPGIGIASITQTTTSKESGGVNIVTVKLTNEETVTFEVTNGSKGEQGSVGPQGPQGVQGDAGAFAWSLLDNGDFTNPVNLDGKQRYGPGATINKWTVGNNGAVSVNDGYISITNSSDASRIIFMQALANNHVGDKLTIAICDHDTGEIHFSTADVPAVASTETYFNIINFNGHTCRFSLTSEGVLRFQVVVDKASTVNLRWAGAFKGQLGEYALSTYAPKGYGVEVINCNGGAANAYKGVFSVSGWSSSAPYTQSITVSGVFASDVPFVDVNLESVSDVTATLEAWALIDRVTVADKNTVVAYCYDEKPSVAVPILLKVVR